MKICQLQAIAPAKTEFSADHLNDKHEVAEISRTSDGPDPFYANLSDRVCKRGDGG